MCSPPSLNITPLPFKSVIPYMGIESLSSISSLDNAGKRLGESGSSPPEFDFLFLPKPKNAPPLTANKGGYRCG